VKVYGENLCFVLLFELLLVENGVRTRCVQYTWYAMAKNAETRKTDKQKEKVVKETNGSVPSKKKNDDWKILQLLTGFKQNMNSSEQKILMFVSGLRTWKQWIICSMFKQKEE